MSVVCANTAAHREATEQGYIYHCTLHTPSYTRVRPVTTTVPCGTKLADDGCPACSDERCNYGDVCGEQARLEQERIG